MKIPNHQYAAFIVFLIFITHYSNAQTFSWPVKIPIQLAANFGDIRTDHYHTGYDIRTRGKIGLPVYAAASGYVSRIRISPYGYGISIYITHPNGLMTVYGHLSRFNSALQSFILKQQNSKQQNEVDLTLSPHEFPVTAGELIAFSGNTGDSGGPHLHFEIRDAHGETYPLNPALYGLKVKDHVPPSVTKIYFFPIDEDGHAHEPMVFPVRQKGAATYDTAEVAFHRFGVAFEGADYMEGTSNDFSFYDSDLWFDSLRRFTIRFDRLDFLKAECVNAHIDYAVFQSTGTVIHRMWKLPGDVHTIYHNVIQNGIINLADSGFHQMQLVTTDANRNHDTVELLVRSKSASPFDTMRFHPKYKWFHYDSTNQVVTDSFQLQIQPGSLFEDMDFQYSEINISDSQRLSPSFSVGDSSVPLFKPFSISILPDQNISDSLKSKLLIIRDDGKRERALTSRPEGNIVTASSQRFGVFYVSIDTTKPLLKTLNVTDSASFSGNTIIFDVSDKLSGILSYNAWLDGRWTRLQYDPKADQIACDLPVSTTDGYHQLKLEVQDAVKNTVSLTITFKKITHAGRRTKSTAVHRKGPVRK